MPAGIADKFTQGTNGTRPSPTTLSGIKLIGASSISCSALTGWPTVTAVHFIIYNTTTSGAKVAGSQTDWKGIVSGTTITNLSLQAGSDTQYSIGAVVEAAPSAMWANDMVAGMTAQHNQDGTHGAITSTSETTGNLTVTTSATLPTGSITGANLATSAIKLGYNEITTSFTTATVGSWVDTGISVAVTVPAGGRDVEIIAYAGQIRTSAVGGSTINLGVLEGATVLGSTGISSAASGYNYTGIVVARVAAPSAGSHTYKVSLGQSAAGTAVVQAGTANPTFGNFGPAYILVKLV